VQTYVRQFGGRECVDYTFSWDQRATGWDPGTAEGSPSGGRVPTGTYSIELLWWGHDNPGRTGDPHYPGVVPDRVPFEIA
ncbi:MAG TPA: hypothetical protein VF230_08890, partial [Acidimicrobiales bacterium]